LKDLHLKLLGLPRVETQKCLNLLRSDLHQKLSCILLLQNGFKAIEIYPSESISGLTLLDGNSSTLLLSFEQESFYGRKDILLMLHRKKLKKKYMTSLMLMLIHMKIFWLFPLQKELNQREKHSLELITQLL